MMKRICIVVLIILILTLTACQPTPEEQVITQKDNIEELIQNTAAPTDNGETQTTNIPETENSDEPQPTEEPKETYKETLEFEDEVFKVIIDAVIDEPDGPITVAMVEPYIVTQEDVDRALKIFMPNRQLYELNELEDFGARDSLQKRIFRLESLIAQIKGDEALDDQIRRSLIAIHSTQIGMLESMLNDSTTDFLKWIETTSEFKEADNNRKTVAVKADMGKSLFAYFLAVSAENGGNSINFGNDDFDGCINGIKRINGDIPGMKTTFNEAKKLAENAIKQVGLVEEVGLVYTELGAYSTAPDEDWIETKYIQKRYMFYFASDIGGLKITNIPTCKGFEQEGVDDYDYRWGEEYIFVAVDDTGIVEFVHAFAGKITEIINDNVEVIDFNEAMEIFRKQIFFEGVWTGKGITFSDLNITKIQLNMFRLRLKDTNEYMYVPVWDFIGTWKTDYYATEPGKEFTFLTINAIDGSIIDRGLGY